MKKRLFKETVVWFEESEDVVIRYRLFQDLSNGKFFVANANIFRNDFEKNLRFFEKNDIEILLGSGLTRNTEEYYDTIEEAISAHEADFE